MLATEPTTHEQVLETWSENERMRHIPSLSWMAQKLDTDVRSRIEKLWPPYADLHAGDEHHAPIEAEMRALCRSLDRVADVARRHRGNGHPPSELGARLGWAITHAVSNLNAADTQTFGKRMPFHTFERSNAEPLWAAVLTVIQHVNRLTDLVREIDPRVDERIYENLVQLHEPLRREPIA